MRIKIMAWILLFSMCMVSAPIPESAKDMTEKEIQAAVSEVVKVSDLDSFLEAAVTAVKEDEADIEAIENPWKNKRLLVKSDREFDSMEAEHMIAGYEDMFILEYASEEKTRAAYQALKKMPGVIVEADGCYAAAEEWSGQTKKEEAFLESKKHTAVLPGGEEVLAAVLDTGYDMKSYESTRLAPGIDLTGSDTISDANGHGTAMANIILNHTPDCIKIMPIKVADEKGYTSSLKLYAGIRYAVENGADIINISMSAYKSSGFEILRLAICEAREEGVLVVVSAGNAGCDVLDFSPSNVKEAVVVSAIGMDKKIAGYSNYGSYVDFCSFGTARIPGLNGEDTRQEGTSVASALVSAAFAEQKAYHGGSTCDELEKLLSSQAEDLGEMGWDDLYGNGLILPGSVQEEGGEETKDSWKMSPLLSCDWKNIPVEELNDHIGKAANLERRVFLDRLNPEEKNLLFSKNTLFSEDVIYSENFFDEAGSTTETFRMEGKLYDIVMSREASDLYEIQAQKYHVFTYGSENGTRSSIRLDTDANENDAVIYCWMKDRSSDNQNSGQYGITFVRGKSAYDFNQCTHKIENCDVTDAGNPVVWRLKIRKIKISKPGDMAVNYDSGLWDKSTFKIAGNTSSGWKAHYWYIYNYQVKPASDADRQRAYGNGSYHGGFWDLKEASGKKCGETVVTTAVDIGTRDLYADKEKAGITYRLPLIAHKNKSKQKNVTDAASTCTKSGSYHTETTYTCNSCDKTWMVKGSPVEVPQLAHVFAVKTAEDNGIVNGRSWEECVRNCGGNDVNNVFWQRNFKYLHPVRYWEMNIDGSYDIFPAGTERDKDYYAENIWIPLWSRTPSVEYQTGKLESFAAPSKASYHDVYIPRKQYKVQYEGNGASGGKTESQRVYCGKIFNLRENGFKRIGYDFKGWSMEKEGPTLNAKGVKNLSLIHGQTVMLYAQWEPKTIKIYLDCQDAGNKGTTAVYEQYAEGYYKNPVTEEKFGDNKIEVPQKEREDQTLLEGRRRQQFLGYYTRKKNGYKMIEKDGTLIADINRAGDYKYFSRDSVVYAEWEDMYAVQFHPNLTKKDMELLGKDENGAVLDVPVICPFTRWKEKGGSIIIGFGEAVIKSTKWKPFYRFLGWSLTPEISSADEIILNEDACAYTFDSDEDVTLYAQWDTAFVTAYMGNGALEGNDFLIAADHITEDYIFAENPFCKTVSKPTIDIATGKEKNEDGEPYMETVPYSFLGWSMTKEYSKENFEKTLFKEQNVLAGNELILAAAEIQKQETEGGLTFGAPVGDFGDYRTSDALFEEEVPFINLYAVWDQYPQIKASDLYLPLADARGGILTEDYLLSLAVAVDEELRSNANPDGIMKNGTDPKNLTSFTILDYQAADFTEAEADMNLTITYRAKDRAGNVTTKMVRVYLADISEQADDAGSVRFISKEYEDTLAENSVWRTGEHAKKLAWVLGNKKTGEEYIKVAPLQQAFGIPSVKKPGSGTWDHVQEVWEFSHEEVLAIQAYAAAVGVGKDPFDFLEKFGHCRIQ